MRGEAGIEAGSPESLSRRLAGGDPAAPRELVERHRAELFRYSRALLGGPEAAEDAVQEAFSRAFAALGGYPEERIESLSLRPWLYRITLNVVRNVWREGDRERSVPEIAPSPGGARDEAREESWMDALDALAKLPERQRVAVALRYLEDLPYAGVAAATGWPENTCKTLVRRGIGRLGTLLADEAGPDQAR
ncbi:RNA polymerase sigma factor [Rubrobacter aplysinae]|uniref:RNA polymerase sigma factor n=1 Tax=Rubrobacter aplysinae TaxID=909625 RepID=UPI00069F1432|nr:RNA polymerase sigma factor [Rubrobacter aplysinae]